MKKLPGSCGTPIVSFDDIHPIYPTAAKVSFHAFSILKELCMAFIFKICKIIFRDDYAASYISFDVLNSLKQI